MGVPLCPWTGRRTLSRLECGARRDLRGNCRLLRLSRGCADGVDTRWRARQPAKGYTAQGRDLLPDRPAMITLARPSSRLRRGSKIRRAKPRVEVKHELDGSDDDRDGQPANWIKESGEELGAADGLAELIAEVRNRRWPVRQGRGGARLDARGGPDGLCRDCGEPIVLAVAADPIRHGRRPLAEQGRDREEGRLAADRCYDLRPARRVVRDSREQFRTQRRELPVPGRLSGSGWETRRAAPALSSP